MLTLVGKKAGEVAQEILKASQQAAEQIKKSAEQLGDAPGVKQVAQVRLWRDLSIEESYCVF